MKLFIYALGRKLVVLGIYSENLFIKGKKETAAIAHGSSCKFRIKIKKQKKFALFVQTPE